MSDQNSPNVSISVNEHPDLCIRHITCCSQAFSTRAEVVLSWLKAAFSFFSLTSVLFGSIRPARVWILPTPSVEALSSLASLFLRNWTLGLPWRCSFWMKCVARRLLGWRWAECLINRLMRLGLCWLTGGSGICSCLWLVSVWAGVVQAAGLQSREPGYRQSYPPQGRLRSHLLVWSEVRRVAHESWQNSAIL